MSFYIIKKDEENKMEILRGDEGQKERKITISTEKQQII